MSWTIVWKGSKLYIQRNFRLIEVKNLLWDASKAAMELRWTPKISFFEIVDEMVSEDIGLLIVRHF